MQHRANGSMVSGPREQAHGCTSHSTTGLGSMLSGPRERVRKGERKRGRESRWLLASFHGDSLNNSLSAAFSPRSCQYDAAHTHFRQADFSCFHPPHSVSGPQEHRGRASRACCRHSAPEPRGGRRKTPPAGRRVHENKPPPSRLRPNAVRRRGGRLEAARRRRRRGRGRGGAGGQLATPRWSGTSAASGVGTSEVKKATTCPHSARQSELRRRRQHPMGTAAVCRAHRAIGSRLPNMPPPLLAICAYGGRSRQSALRRGRQPPDRNGSRLPPPPPPPTSPLVG